MPQLMSGHCQNSKTKTVPYNGHTFLSTHRSYPRVTKNRWVDFCEELITACHKKVNLFRIENCWKNVSICIVVWLIDKNIRKISWFDIAKHGINNWFLNRNKCFSLTFSSLGAKLPILNIYEYLDIAYDLSTW